MKTSVQLRQEIGEHFDTIEAITQLATVENRGLSDKEQKEIDDTLAMIGVEDDGSGKPTGLYAEVKRHEKIESLKLSLSSKRVAETQQAPTGVADHRFTVPAAARYRAGKLKAFHGPDAERSAYASGQWLAATLFGNEKAKSWCIENGVNPRNALSGGSLSKGGYLVPDEMESAIIDLREARGVFRQYARNKLMATDTASVARRSGGLTGYWVGDNTEITASDKSWDNVTLTAKKLGVLCKYSSEISEDAIISMADDLTSEIAYTLANSEDTAGFLGDGTSTYGGIKGLISAIAAGSTVTAATGNTAFSTLDDADFESMVGKLPQYPGIDPAWYIHKAGWADSMLRLARAGGGNTIREFADGLELMYLGYPVRFVQVMNSTLAAQTSTNGLCYFGDLGMSAVIGTRRGVEIAISTDRYFELDQLAIKGTERVDINVHETGTATAASSMIMLATPAS